MDISRETFKDSDGDTRELILFDSIADIANSVEKICGNCDTRHEKVDEKIDKVSRQNKYLSGGGGILGGMLSAIGLKFLG
ncbi:MAG: hypothetical protein HKO79_12485 [Desulfobacterales bacterium]|nr:hypothetical protein [Desulfobacterales bacterium]